MYTASSIFTKLNELLASNAKKADIIKAVSGFCLEWPYVFAASGKECTIDIRKYFAEARPDHKNAIYKACLALSKGKDICDKDCKYYGTLCFDCRGFTRWLLSLVDIYLYGDTVTTQWETKSNWVLQGPIKDMPKGLVCCVFRPSHTGTYVGDNLVRHCGGRKGCVQEEFLPGSPNWQKFGIPAGLYSNDELRKAGVYVDEALNFPTLRKGATGDRVRRLQQALNEEMDAGLEVDGSFGAKTEAAVKRFQQNHPYLKVDGIVGPKTWEALSFSLEDNEAIDIPETDKPDSGEDYIMVPRETIENWVFALNAFYNAMKNFLDGE